MSALPKILNKKATTGVLLASLALTACDSNQQDTYNPAGNSKPSGGLCIKVGATAPLSANTLENYANQTAAAMGEQIKTSSKTESGRFDEQVKAGKGKIKSLTGITVGAFDGFEKASKGSCKQTGLSNPNGGAFYVNGNADDIRNKSGSWFGIAYGFNQEVKEPIEPAQVTVSCTTPIIGPFGGQFCPV